MIVKEKNQKKEDWKMFISLLPKNKSKVSLIASFYN